MDGIDAPWYDDRWQYRRPIAVTNASATLALVKYEVPVAASGADFSFDRAGPRGQDVRFTGGDGTTLIAHWIESYDPAARRAVFLVAVPHLPASTTTVIYLYYGNANADPTGGSGYRTFARFDGFERLRNAPTYLTTPTYDGSGQTVHPDVAHFPRGWNGYEYWMVMTPYPNGNDRYENPSILASHDGISWSVPAGLVNPLVPAPPCDHNSDANMIYNDTTDELWVYYLDARRASRCAGHGGQPYYNHQYLKVVTSRDGRRWSRPKIVMDFPLGGGQIFPVSPSIVKQADRYYLWLVSAAEKSVWFAESGDGLSFTALRRVGFANPVWHLNVEYIAGRDEYWMVYSYPDLGGSLRFATSGDRTTWTVHNTPMLAPTTGWDRNLYRATFLYDEYTNLLRVWYSARGDTQWRTGYAAVEYDALLSQIGADGLWTKAGGTGTWAASTDRAKRGAFSGRLVQTGAVRSTSMIRTRPNPLPNNFHQEVDLYDDMDATAFKIMRCVSGSGSVGIGVWTGASTSRYVIHDKVFGYTVTGVSRSAGWHKLGILLREDATVTFAIDGQDVGGLTGQFADADRVAVEGYWGGTTTFHVDDIRVRRWTPTPPSASIGAEEALS